MIFALSSMRDIGVFGNLNQALTFSCLWSRFAANYLLSGLLDKNYLPLREIK